MNRQPYASPPCWWAPRLTPWCVRWSRGYRWRQLRDGQRIERIDVFGAEQIQSAVAAGQGVLIAPNHSTHYDSAALYIACDRIDQPLYFMTAWQVFAMSTRFERWAMQRLGCFSIDRESTDRQAFKQAIDLLATRPHPLVIFPEGDIYHTNDAITPFRDGAAAIALSAAKRAERPIVIVPCGIKFFYVDDPTDDLLVLMRELEARIYLRPQPERTLVDRIHRLAEAAIALKELDYFGATRSGSLRVRRAALIEAVLAELEERHHLSARGASVPERSKALRQAVIKQLAASATTSDQSRQQLHEDMESIFFVMQLYSYPGDYLHPGASIERIAETLDKFEEDILQRDLPSVRGRRRVVVKFGKPLEVTRDPDKKANSAQLTQSLHAAVQSLIDEINESPP